MPAPAHPHARDGGLPDDIEAEIADAAFEFRDNFTEFDTDKPLCLLVLTLEDTEGNEHTQFYKLASKANWEPADDGKSAVWSDDPDMDRHVSAQGELGKLLDAIQAIPEADAECLRRFEEDEIGYLDAAYWLGLKFHWGRKEFPWKMKQDGEERSGVKEMLLPDKFLGVAGSGGGGKTKAPAKKAPAKKSRSRKKADGPTDVAREKAKELYDDNTLFEGVDDEFEVWLEAVVDGLGDDATEADLAWLRDTGPDGAWESLSG